VITLVIVDRQTDETVCHRQYVPFIEDERGASSEREKTQEGMTSSATHLVFLRTRIRQVISCPRATGWQVRQVLVVLRQHGERLFPTQRRLEKTGERENPGGDKPVRVYLSVYLLWLLIIIMHCTIAKLLCTWMYYKPRHVRNIASFALDSVASTVCHYRQESLPPQTDDLSYMVATRRRSRPTTSTRRFSTRSVEFPAISIHVSLKDRLTEGEKERLVRKVHWVRGISWE